MKFNSLTTRVAACFLLTLLATGCRKTGKLSLERQAQFEKETIACRADDLIFRRTRPAGQRDSGWDEKRASIIVTRETVFLHVNGNALVEITPRSTGFYEVHRNHDRVSLRAGSGKSALSWSFRPADNADAWTVAIRAVIKNTKPSLAGE
jgi:hypothetical protein